MKALGFISANYTSDNFEGLLNHRALASVPFGGRYRLIDFALSNMVNSGISTVGLVMPYNYESLIDHVGVGKDWNLAKKNGGLFLMPGVMAGMRATDKCFLFGDFQRNRSFFERDEADVFVVSNSTNIANLHYEEALKIHDEADNPITLIYKKVDNAQDYPHGRFLTLDENGIVKKISSQAKGEANYFVDSFIIDKDYMLNLIDDFGLLETTDIVDIFANEVNSVSYGTIEITGYLGTITSIDEYMTRSLEMIDDTINKAIFAEVNVIYTKIRDEAPSHIKAGSKVKKSLIAAGCTIEGTVEHSIIFRGVHIKKGAVVKNSVVMPYTVVNEDAHIDRVILDKNVTVGKNASLVSGTDRPIIIGKYQNV